MTNPRRFLITQNSAAAVLNFLFICAISVSSYAKAPLAQSYYLDGQFEDAFTVYSDLIAVSNNNAPLLYNYANTCFRLYQKYGPEHKEVWLARAITAWEKAKKLSPEDKDIQFNLRYARQFTIDRFEEDNTTNPLTRIVFFFYFMFSANQLVAGAILFFFLGSLFVVCVLIFKPCRIKIMYSVCIGFFLLWGIFFGSSLYKQHSESVVQAGIISQKEAAVYTEPSDNSKIATKIHEGSKVYIRRTEINWINIALPNGFTGWIRNGEIFSI